MDFEWNDEKARLNLKKHRVAFEDAVRAFFDPWAITIQDRFEDGEERWQTIGLVDGVRLLLVAHTIRDDNGRELIRIISARRAEPHERRRYDQRKNH